MFQLIRKRQGVYLLNFNNHVDLCYAFMRYQEFYESPNQRFQGKTFTWPTYMKWNMTKYNDKKSKQFRGKYSFGYADQWAGFNIPLDVIKQVHDMGIPDPNEYDALMLSVYKMISRNETKAYLIGAPPGGQAEQHELTHSLWFLNSEYKNAATKIIVKPAYARCTRNLLVIDLKKCLFDIGYTESVVIDEINAFVTTGEAGWLNSAAKKHYKEMMSLRRELKALHNEFYPAFTADMK